MMRRVGCAVAPHPSQLTSTHTRTAGQSVRAHSVRSDGRAGVRTDSASRPCHWLRCIGRPAYTLEEESGQVRGLPVLEDSVV